MISIQNLSKAFEIDSLFENVNLIFHQNDKVALVGANGSGKTTFFNCLVGKESFNGRIISSDIKISLMEQEQNFSNLDMTFQEYLEKKKHKIEERRKSLELEIGNPEIYEDENKFDSLMDKYNLLLSDSTFDREQNKTKDILNELKIDEETLNKKIKALSGGQKTKLRLAECLSIKADLYLLDEPTNNLDLVTRNWLEDYIKENIENLIVISHDRYFLNNVVNKVWDLENKQIKEWNYSFNNYLTKKREALEVMEKKYKDAMKLKKKKLDAAKEIRRWGAAAGTKKKYILARRIEREAEKLDEVENPSEFLKDITVDFKGKSLHNCDIFRLEDVSKKFDKTLFENVNQEIEFGEKVCIVGENGSGKTTLLRMLIGEVQPSTGEIYQRKNLQLGYFDQELKGIDKEKTVMEFFIDETGKFEEDLIPIFLKYGFMKESFEKKIKYLSGGERGRLNIMRITLEKNNVLILDEPTNNLDVYMIESLENALNKFGGTIIFVSHDRYFVENIANRILEIKDGKVSSFRGNYENYLGESEG